MLSIYITKRIKHKQAFQNTQWKTMGECGNYAYLE